MKGLDALKQRWGVKNYWDVAIILIVFACTGFSVMYAKRAFFMSLGIDNNTATWVKWVLNIFVVLPAYQLFLLAYGWLFGKFFFFLNFEKKMLNRLLFWK